MFQSPRGLMKHPTFFKFLTTPSWWTQNQKGLDAKRFDSIVSFRLNSEIFK